MANQHPGQQLLALICALGVAPVACGGETATPAGSASADVAADVAADAAVDAAVEDTAADVVLAEDTAADIAADTAVDDDASATVDTTAGPDDASFNLCKNAPPCPTDGDGWCLVHVCDPDTGSCVATPRNEGAPCEDGVACHLGTTCNDGVCAGGFDVCACQSDTDCPAAEPGNLCAGQHYCNKGTWPWSCALNPATVVSCQPSSDACSHNVCLPATGACASQPLPEGKACDDGDACTSGDACKAGSCVAGSNDVCKCASDADCSGQEDGDLCNGTLYCDLSSGACKVNPATTIQCPTASDGVCSKTVCYPKTGLCQASPVEKLVQACAGGLCHWALAPPDAATPTKVACDDGDACTIGDVCKGGSCVYGTDTCACAVDSDCAKLEDGNACNGKLFCNGATGQCALNPATIVLCPSADDTACLKNACSPKTGLCSAIATGLASKICDGPTGPSACRWEHKPAGEAETLALPCDDGDPCSVGDTCGGGVCLPGAATCTCQTDADCPDDGDVCNGVPACNKLDHTCALNPTTIVTCPTVDDTVCRASLCTPKTGQCLLTPINDGGNCDDGQACTKSDTCSDGACKSGPFTCECASDADCAKLEDGNACNGTLYCDKTGAAPKCTVNPSTIVVCAKASGSPCLLDTCDPVKGSCAFAPGNENGACDDGNACTDKDACSGGVCVGDAASCDDGNACSVDACTPAKGCSHVFKVCDDGNSCTADTCETQTGLCSFPTAPKNGANCIGDGDGCTLADHCVAGVCTVGPAAICKISGLGNCEQAICVATSASSFVCQAGAKPVGTPCDDGKPCTVGTSCTSAGQCAGSYTNKLFDGYLVGPSGQGGFNATALHTDGDFALAGYTNKGGWGAANVWWVARLSPGGQLRWHTKYGGGNLSVQSAHAVTTDATGRTRAAGCLVDSAGSCDMATVRWDAKGAVVDAWTVKASANEQATAMVVTPGEALLLAGARYVSGAADPHAVLLDPKGQVLWTRTVTSPGGYANLAGAVVLDDGDFLLTGSGWATGSPIVYHGFVWSLGSDGVSGGFERVGDNTGPAPSAIAVRNGRVLIAGTAKVTDYNNSEAWIAELRDDRRIRWQASVASAARVNGAAWTPDGQVVLAGARRTGSVFSAWTASGDRHGNPTSSSDLAVGDNADMRGVIGLPDGGRFVVGTRYYKSAWRGQFWRLDAFGNSSCGSSGACANLGSCDDGKDCTRDGCDATAGCLHTPVEQLRCDPNDGCSMIGSCSKGSCGASASGRLWARADAIGEATAQHGNTIALDDGDVAVVGQARVSGQDRAFLRRLNPYGEQRWLAAWNVAGKPAHAVGAAALQGGDVVVASRGGDGITFGDLRRYNASGGLVWAKNTGFFIKYRPMALTSYKDGTFGLLLQPTTTPYDRLLVTRYNPDLSLAWAKGNSDAFTLGTIAAKPALPWFSADATALTGHIYGPQLDAVDDGTTLVAGGLNSGASGTKTEAWMGRLTTTGTVQWQKRFGLGQSSATYFLDVAARSDGGGYAVGARNLSAQQGWLVRVDPKGATLWERTFDGYGHAFNAAVVLPNGDLLASGSKLVTASKQQPFLVHESATGGLGWQRIWDARVGYANGLALLGNGDLLVGVSDGPSKVATTLHTDAWGHEGCTAAGGCLQPPKSCDDGKPCTIDACLNGGCLHTPVPCP